MGIKNCKILYYFECITTDTTSLLDSGRWPGASEILMRYVTYRSKHSFLKWFLHYDVGDDIYIISAKFERSQ